MTYQYYIFILLSAFFLLFRPENAHSRQSSMIQSFILDGSKLRINGTSNVTDFECIYLDQISNDTLHHTTEFGDSLFVSGDIIRLNSSSFDCGKKGINRDLRKTLNSEEYPFLIIELVSIEISDSVPFNASLFVSISGVRRKELVEITAFENTDNSFTFSGSTAIQLTNFGLTPPTALFGLVKVDDLILISFDLIVEK